MIGRAGTSDWLVACAATENKAQSRANDHPTGRARALTTAFAKSSTKFDMQTLQSDLLYAPSMAQQIEQDSISCRTDTVGMYGDTQRPGGGGYVKSKECQVWQMPTNTQPIAVPRLVCGDSHGYRIQYNCQLSYQYSRHYKSGFTVVKK